MKRFLATVMLLAVLAATLAAPALASEWRNYWAEGWYRVRITMPKGHDHIYLYDEPSSTRGSYGPTI